MIWWSGGGIGVFIGFKISWAILASTVKGLWFRVRA